jgi:hypothetical protein
MRRAKTQGRIDWLSTESVIAQATSAYVAWRESCMLVSETYSRWRESPCEDSALAFALYRGALEREERAAARYAVALSAGAQPVFEAG